MGRQKVKERKSLAICIFFFIEELKFYNDSYSVRCPRGKNKIPDLKNYKLSKPSRNVTTL